MKCVRLRSQSSSHPRSSSRGWSSGGASVRYGGTGAATHLFLADEAAVHVAGGVVPAPDRHSLQHLSFHDVAAVLVDVVVGFTHLPEATVTTHEHILSCCVCLYSDKYNHRGRLCPPPPPLTFGGAPDVSRNRGSEGIQKNKRGMKTVSSQQTIFRMRKRNQMVITKSDELARGGGGGGADFAVYAVFVFKSGG